MNADGERETKETKRTNKVVASTKQRRREENGKEKTHKNERKHPFDRNARDYVGG